MKIREAITLLKSLIVFLEKHETPNIEIDNFFSIEQPKKRKNLTNEEIKVNLDTLIKLSSLDKSQWIEFATLNHIDIQIRPKDSSRDVLIKILRYLDSNPIIKHKIEKEAEASSTVHSPELTRALKILLSKQ